MSKITEAINETISRLESNPTEEEINEILNSLKNVIEGHNNRRMLIARIFNIDEGDYGKIFSICEEHWEQMKKRLARRAPQCILYKVAYDSIADDLNWCQFCEEEEDIDE